MPRHGVFRNYYIENVTSAISFMTKCHKLFQGTKTTLNSYSSTWIKGRALLYRILAEGPGVARGKNVWKKILKKIFKTNLFSL